MKTTLGQQRRKVSARVNMSTASLQNSVLIINCVFLIVAASESLTMGWELALSNLILCGLYAFVFFYGNRNWQKWPIPGQWAWLVSLTAVWIMLMAITGAALYLIMPLCFIYLRVLNGWRGVVAVIAATALTIGVQIPGGLTPGGVLGPSFSALIIVIVYSAYRTLWLVSEDRQELIEELLNTQAELAESQRTAGMAAERQRLAHEIHDTVAQGLSSIQMLLHVASRDLAQADMDAGDRERIEQRLEQARSTASDNLAEARAMIAALQPASLSEHSLEDALNRAARSYGASAQTVIDVDVVGEPYPLPMKVEAALLRIAQGAVGNVMKHANASKARITLSYEEDEIRLDVVDNGDGFDPAAVEARPAGLGHVGLSALRRRAEEIGSALTIESTPGRGTALSVAVRRDGGGQG
ncbi:sensor histidine kinase [Corynebacterium renale]|nr:sensor histidine kinase [Corynebacterium renale]